MAAGMPWLLLGIPLESSVGFCSRGFSFADLVSRAKPTQQFGTNKVALLLFFCLCVFATTNNKNHTCMFVRFLFCR